ncbi:TPA: BppU family phage baseplate upper protein [Clostridium perfringens]
MKEIKINVDSYNSDSINTIQGNNNAEVYKIYVLFNKRRIDLTGKTVKMAYLRTGTVEGDVINLNITNATEGEITLQITNSISKRDGVYSCQLAIYGADGFLEHTATFGLTVEANIFNKIAGEIENSKDLTYIERILEEAKTVSGDLKTNIPVADNLNRSLEDNINKASNINNTLADTTERSKVAAIDAIEKKSDLESSIVEAKKFIDGLDGSQNIPQIRMDVNELQNGLKSNQALAYTGGSISANDTLEGRTEGMRIKGRTMENLFPQVLTKNYSFQGGGDVEGNALILPFGTDVNDTAIRCIKNKALLKPNQVYTVIVNILSNNTNQNLGMSSYLSALVPEKNSFDNKFGISKMKCTSRNLNEDYNCDAFFCIWGNGGDKSTNIKFTAVLLKGDWTDKEAPSYFEGVKSFGEVEGNKISILSHSENLIDTSNSHLWQLNKGLWSHGNGENPNSNGGMITDYIDISYIKNVKLFLKGKTRNYFFCYYDENKKALMNITKEYLKPSNAKFIRFYVIINEDSAPLTKFVNPYLMLSYDTFKDYKPYVSDKKEISISEPLRSIGDIEDVMYEDNGQVKVDRYIGVKKYQEGDENNKSVITDKNNTYYVLDKPVTEIVENCVDIDLDTFGEKTYFNILNSLPGTLDFKVPSNIASIVQSNSKAINELYNLIDTLVLPNILQNTTDIEMLKLEKLK